MHPYKKKYDLVLREKRTKLVKRTQQIVTQNTDVHTVKPSKIKAWGERAPFYYPNWWYGVPMALLSFLENNDLSGKDIYLFCSHGTGGLADSVDIITEAVPDAEISDNIFDCYEEDASSSEEVIREWVQELGYSGAQSEDAV